MTDQSPTPLTDSDKSLTDRRAVQLIEVLDLASNLWGPLAPEQRARVYAACENPTSETWDDAYSILVSADSFTTLWQAVLRYTTYDIRSKPLDESWPSVPTAQQIVLALRETLG